MFDQASKQKGFGVNREHAPSTHRWPNLCWRFGVFTSNPVGVGEVVWVCGCILFNLIFPCKHMMTRYTRSAIFFKQICVIIVFLDQPFNDSSVWGDHNSFVELYGNGYSGYRTKMFHYEKTTSHEVKCTNFKVLTVGTTVYSKSLELTCFVWNFMPVNR